MQYHRDNRFDVIVVQVAQQWCCVPLAVSEEIVAMPELSRPAGMPGILYGLLNLGGQMIPVLRTSRLLGLADEQPALYTPLLIVNHEGSRFALMVTSICGVATFDPQQIYPLTDQHTAAGAVTYQGKVVAILDLQRLLLEKERLRVQELRAAAEQRLDDLTRTEAMAC